MTLPGIEWADPSPATAECADDGSHPTDTAETSARPPDPDALDTLRTCPNCGGTEFDEDGDCIRCWEPGVVPGGSRRNVEES
jgi:hypothetical protein